MVELETYKKELLEQLERQRCFFRQGKTLDLNFRKDQLKKLQMALQRYEPEILDALQQDLHKSPEEAFLTEISLVRSEIRMHLKHLRPWAKSKRVGTSLSLFPSQGFKFYEPLGLVLILSPWNYPLQLILNPLVGAISAGNCALLKPSPLAAATSKVLKKIIDEIYDAAYICVWEGDGPQTQLILKEAFDLIFFTGSSSFGKEVMKAAAEHLSPVVLELGGKSPCVVDQGCYLELAAKRIVWGKLINAGQTCIAPDYIWVHSSLKIALIEALKKYMVEFYGEDSACSPHYPRLISVSAYQRLSSYLDELKEGEVVFGGQRREQDLWMSPTLVLNPSMESALMQNEIFGPILPILSFDSLSEVENGIKLGPKPLALYYFGKSPKGKAFIHRIPSGGACINDVLLHILHPKLPFGGVGYSGMGKYHGKYSFKAFSHERALIHSVSGFDMIFKYVPFRFFRWIKPWL